LWLNLQLEAAVVGSLNAVDGLQEALQDPYVMHPL
jgi:hypothetical protein